MSQAAQTVILLAFLLALTVALSALSAPDAPTVIHP